MVMLEIAKILKGLVDYTVFHFDYEEKMMKIDGQFGLCLLRVVQINHSDHCGIYLSECFIIFES